MQILRTPLAARDAHQLSERGYVILKAAADPDRVRDLDRRLAPTFARTAFCRGAFYGETTKRFGGLLARDPDVASFVLNPRVLALVQEMLGPWCETLQLNLTQAVAVHPGAPAQLPHRDHDMWGAEKGRLEYLVNVMWPLTPFRPENGATRIWPDSHGPAACRPGVPGTPLAMTCEPGDAVLFLGSTLHGAGENRSSAIRRGMIIGYCLGWLKPYENQWLVYPPPVAAKFPEELQRLIGYAQHRPNLGNVEGRCPSELLRGGLCGPPEDALRPDQIEAITAFLHSQNGASGVELGVG